MNVVGKAAGTARAAARPSTYSENRVPAALALWLILVLIAVARNSLGTGQIQAPDRKHAVALGVAAIFIAFAAAVAPKFVFYVLLAAALVVAATNSDTIVRAVDLGSSKVRGALADA